MHSARDTCLAPLPHCCSATWRPLPRCAHPNGAFAPPAPSPQPCTRVCGPSCPPGAPRGGRQDSDRLRLSELHARSTRSCGHGTVLWSGLGTVYGRAHTSLTSTSPCVLASLLLCVPAPSADLVLLDALLIRCILTSQVIHLQATLSSGRSRVSQAPEMV